MPKEGFKSVTIRAELYKELNEIATKENRSIAAIIQEAMQEFVATHKVEPTQ